MQCTGADPDSSQRVHKVQQHRAASATLRTGRPLDVGSTEYRQHLEVVDTNGQECDVYTLLVQHVADDARSDDDDNKPHDEQPGVVGALGALTHRHNPAAQQSSCLEY